MGVHFFVPLVPVAKARARVTRFGTYTPKKSKNAETELRGSLDRISKVYPDFPMVGPVDLELTFHLPKPKSVRRLIPDVRPDLDNYAKLFMDAANGILWKDDGQVCLISAEKRYAADRPGVMVEIAPYDLGGDDD